MYNSFEFVMNFFLSCVWKEFYNLQYYYYFILVFYVENAKVFIYYFDKMNLN